MKRIIITPQQLHEALNSNNLTVSGINATDVKAKSDAAVNAAKSAGLNGTVTGVLDSKSKTSNTLNGVTASSDCDDSTKSKVLDAGGGVGVEIKECTTKRKIEERRLEHMKKTGLKFTKSQLDEMIKQ